MRFKQSSSSGPKFFFLKILSCTLSPAPLLAHEILLPRRLIGFEKNILDEVVDDDADETTELERLFKSLEDNGLYFIDPNKTLLVLEELKKSGRVLDLDTGTTLLGFLAVSAEPSLENVLLKGKSSFLLLRRTMLLFLITASAEIMASLA